MASLATSLTSVHPRPRGEHDEYRKYFEGKNGSSPPTRGTLVKSWDKIPQKRFIPAHAGNTDVFDLINAISSVHPRPRGEHLHLIKLVLVKIRFIPAHAGNTE